MQSIITYMHCNWVHSEGMKAISHKDIFLHSSDELVEFTAQPRKVSLRNGKSVSKVLIMTIYVYFKIYLW